MIVVENLETNGSMKSIIFNAVIYFLSMPVSMRLPTFDCVQFLLDMGDYLLTIEGQLTDGTLGIL